MSIPIRSAALAGGAGAALLGVSFLPWIEEPAGQRNLWQAFGVVDVIVAVAIASALACAALSLFGDTSGLPVVASTLTTGIGAVAVVVLLLRLLDPPGSEDATRELGLWLAPLAAAGITLGGYLGMQGGAPKRQQGR